MAQVDRGIIVPVGRVIPRGTRGDTVFRPNYAIIHNVEIITTLVNEGKTVVMVTHERDLTRYFSRTVMLADGAIVGGAEATA